jgi:hypothetical protein
MTYNLYAFLLKFALANVVLALTNVTVKVFETLFNEMSC